MSSIPGSHILSFLREALELGLNVEGTEQGLGWGKTVFSRRVPRAALKTHYFRISRPSQGGDPLSFLRVWSPAHDSEKESTYIRPPMAGEDVTFTHISILGDQRDISFDEAICMMRKMAA